MGRDNPLVVQVRFRVMHNLYGVQRPLQVL